MGYVMSMLVVKFVERIFSQKLLTLILSKHPLSLLQEFLMCTQQIEGWNLYEPQTARKP